MGLTHEEICKDAKLEIMDEVYIPFGRRIQNRVLPIYQELQSFVVKHKLISVRQFFYHCISIDLRPFPKNATEAKNTYQNLNNITTRSRLGGILPMDSI